MVMQKQRLSIKAVQRRLSQPTLRQSRRRLKTASEQGTHKIEKGTITSFEQTFSNIPPSCIWRMSAMEMVEVY